MDHKVYSKGNILVIEMNTTAEGFAKDILDQIREQLHLIRRPFCLILDYHVLDELGLVIPQSEMDHLIQIIELLDRTGRTHAIWIHQTPSKNAEIFKYLIQKYSISYTKAQEAKNIFEAEKTAKIIMK